MIKIKLLVAFIIVLSLFFQQVIAQENSENYKEEDCYITGVKTVMKCYSLERPLYEGSSETTTLRGVVVPARAAAPELDPLVILAGGPGQAASDAVATLRMNFSDIRSVRDMIFFDIRGSGMSDPVVCDFDDDIAPLTYVPYEERVSIVAECYNKNAGKLLGNTTEMAAADLEALRMAMGVESFNLWGGSYGTRFAQFYMHSYPDRVRSAILDGVVPFAPSYVGLQAENALSALKMLQQDCLDSEACAEAYPGFDPLSLVGKVKDGQAISYIHPVTGERVNTNTSKEVVAQAVFLAIYSPEGRAIVPFALDQAVNYDNWAPLSVLAVDMGKYTGVNSIYIATHLSITCAEEKKNMVFKEGSDGRFFNDNAAQLMKSMCDVWPVASKALPTIEDGSIDIPTVMISGEQDPITPPVMAEHAMVSFSNAKHVVVKGGGHINSTVACVNNFLSKFVKNPEDKSLMPDCGEGSYVPAFIIGPKTNKTGSAG